MKACVYFISALIALSTAHSQAQAPFTHRPYTKDDHARFSYVIFNDEHSITVAVKVDDPAEALKLARNGLDIWIDPKGKKTKKIGIHYPLGQNNDNPQAPQAPRGLQQNGNSGDTGALFLRRQASILLGQKQDVVYQGFRAAVNGTKDLADTSVISIATAYPAKDALYYSVTIPLSALREPLDPARPFSVGIIIKATPMGNDGPDGSPGPGGGSAPGLGGSSAPGPGGGPDGSGAAPGSGGTPGGNGVPPDGGAGPGIGGPPGGDSDDFRKIFGEDAVWLQVKLTP